MPTRRSWVQVPLPAPFEGEYGRRFVKKKCIPCEGNIPPFDYSEIHKYLKKVDGWDVEQDQNKSYFLIKEIKFSNFKDSQNFVNKVEI